MTAQGLQGYVTLERRTELLEALGALVEAAVPRDPASRTAMTRLDQAAARWSCGIAYPADVVTLVGEVRRQRRASRRREDVLERVTLVAVTAVAERQVREALTDPLTGLATRARMEDELQHLLAMSLRSGSPLTAVILDVDGLKKVNDEHGHAAGDAALAEVGRAIREHARQTDRAFRWGGDEFLVLMPGTTERDARTVVERIQHSCLTPTTAGVATHADGESEMDVATWLSEADADLYRRRHAVRTVVPAPRRRSHRPAPAPVVLAVSTLAAATAGWFGVTTAGDLGIHRPARTGTQAASSATHLPPSMSTGRAATAARPTVTTPRTAVAATSRPRTSTPAKPATTQTPPLLPPVVDIPVPSTPAPPSTSSAPPAPEPAPVGLVSGLLDTVRDVLRSVSL